MNLESNSVSISPPCRKTSWMTSPSNWARCRVSRWGGMMSSTLIQSILITSCYSALSKHFSLKVVAKKRRDRGLPRAFEIFTDSKTYVLKAQDEKHAEEWLQCINVAVAQARERENREATTYLWQQHRHKYMPWTCTETHRRRYAFMFVMVGVCLQMG